MYINMLNNMPKETFIQYGTARGKPDLLCVPTKNSTNKPITDTINMGPYSPTKPPSAELFQSIKNNSEKSLFFLSATPIEHTDPNEIINFLMPKASSETMPKASSETLPPETHNK